MLGQGSFVRRISGTPRFTSIDFWMPFSPFVQTLNIPVSGSALQLHTMLDFNRLTVPPISGTDTEDGHMVWDGTGTKPAGVPAAGVLNAPNCTTATWAAATVNGFQITTTVNLPPAILTLGSFVIAGTGNVTGNPANVTIPAGLLVAFPGGAPGVYTMNIPPMVGAVAPALVGDATFVPGGAVIAGIVYTGVSTTHCVGASTWTQPAASGLVRPHTGYVHLNQQNDLIALAPIGGGIAHQIQQSIPIPSSPCSIRVEQEFEQVQVQAINLIATDVCAGILVIEHETEKEVR